MATDKEVNQALLDAIAKATAEADSVQVSDPTSYLLRLAEAYAWVIRPGSSHSGGTAAK
jgi:hypothetical protein